MNLRRIQWFEKTHLQVVTVVALVAGYFLLAPGFHSWDTEGPVAFLPLIGWAGLGVVALELWGMAAVTAILTVSIRPEGALLATLIGAGGISLSSPRIRSLLMERQDALGGLYVQLCLEVLLFAALLVSMEIIVGVVRGVVARIKPSWVWKDPLLLAPSEAAPAAAKSRKKREYRADPVSSFFQRLLASVGRPPVREENKPRLTRESVARSVLCVVLGLIIGMTLMFCLSQSPQRGQVLFALVASFLVAQMIAHWVFPSPYGVVAWITPMLAALLCYALAAAAAGNGRPEAWTDAPLYARALPIDWLTAGGGGALTGYWISSRFHELRHMEKQGKAGSEDV